MLQLYGLVPGTRATQDKFSWIKFELTETGPQGKIQVRISRRTRPEIAEDKLNRDIGALLDMGANYIDICFNTNRLAAGRLSHIFNVDKDLLKKHLDI